MIYDEADAKRCLDFTKWLIEEYRAGLAKLVADRKEALEVLGLGEDPDNLI